MDKIYYAIGDVHGQLQQLKALHQKINDYHQQHHAGQPQVLVHLGDYIDRGEDSCGVIEYMAGLSDTPDCQIINLKGNHEVMMLDTFLSGKASARHYWLGNGGDATWKSYHERGYQQPPDVHLEWLKSLSSQFVDHRRRLVFVHAGIDPQRFPFGDDKIHLWTRSKRFFDTSQWDKNPKMQGVRVIHGHTPTSEPTPDMTSDGRRINLDTGAVYGGKLSAAVISESSVEFLQA